MRVLVADDDPGVRSMLVEFLALRGVEIVEAADGVETLGRVTRSRLDARPLDAIVLDLGMPRLGGIEALRRIRTIDPRIAVIVLTAALEPALHRQASALGASAVLSKPAHLPTLWATIEGHVTSSPTYDVALRTAGITQAAPKPPSETRVLVVDDEAAIRETLVEFLELRRYETSVAADGPSAVQALVREPADIILLDIGMPGLSGADALPTLRALAPQAAIIMVTANVDLDVAKRTLAHGAFDYLLKPINFAHLAQSIEMALALNALDHSDAPPGGTDQEPP